MKTRLLLYRVRWFRVKTVNHLTKIRKNDFFKCNEKIFVNVSEFQKQFCCIFLPSALHVSLCLQWTFIVFVPEQLKIVKLATVLHHILVADVLCHVPITRCFKRLAVMLHNFAIFGQYFTVILPQYYRISNILLFFSVYLSNEKFVESVCKNSGLWINSPHPYCCTL